MMTEVFISYRRKDSLYYARRIYDSIKAKKNRALFIDTSSITPGKKWPNEIRRALSEAKIVLVIIGKNWLIAGLNEYGQRPIDDENDWVRQEILTAIKDKKYIIPVLVGGAEMPPAIALPQCIDILPQIQCSIILDSSFEKDIKKLIDNIWPTTKQPNISTKVKMPSLKIEPKLPLGNYKDQVGREKEVNWLKNHYKKENMAVIIGTAGIGKTFLAGIYASLMPFPDGYLSVFVENRRVEEVAFEILSFFNYKGREPKSQKEANSLLRQYIANSFNGLLILDNVENSSVNFLIPGGSNVKTLITTRHKSVALEITNSSSVYQLREFSPKQCIQLFENYIDTTQEKELIALCHFLGCLPFLIRLAAKLLSENPLRKPIDLIEKYGNSNYPIHSGPELLLNENYDLLIDKEKELLLCLGHCSLKGIKFDFFCKIFNYNIEEYKEYLFKPIRLSLLDIIDGSTLKVHPLTNLFLNNKDYGNSKLEKYLRGLLDISNDKNKIDYLFINEVRSCFDKIEKGRINLYFEIVDGLLSNINLTRYVIIDIMIKLINKASQYGESEEKYIKYYFEISKQYKLLNNIALSNEYIDKYIQFYKHIDK